MFICVCLLKVTPENSPASDSRIPAHLIEKNRQEEEAGIGMELVGWVKVSIFYAVKNETATHLININGIIEHIWIYRGAGMVLNRTIYGRWYSFRP